MKKNYEIYLYNEMYDDSLVEAIVQHPNAALSAMNINGYGLSLLKDVLPCPINISIGWPTAHESLMANCFLLRYYHKIFPERIKGANFGIPGHIIFNQDWVVLKNYLKTLVDICKELKIDSRTFVDMGVIKDYDQLKNIADAIEQSEMGTIVLDNSYNELDDNQLNDFLISAHMIRKQISINVGVFVELEKSAQVEKIAACTFNPCIISPEMFLETES